MAAPSHSVLPRPEPVYAISGHLFSPQQRLDWLWQAKQFAAKAAQACAARRRQQPDQPAQKKVT
jgi:hypothetical protein